MHEVQPQPRDSGLTLYELLIALVVLGLVLTLASSAIGFARRSVESVRPNQTAERAEYVSAYLRELLSSARSTLKPTDDEVLRLAFVGEPDRLEFVSPSPAPSVTPGLYRVIVEMSSEGLVLQYRLDRSSRADFESVSLMAELQNAAFEYGVLNESGDWSWKEDWKHQRALPNALSLRLEFLESSPDEAMTVFIPISSARPSAGRATGDG